MASRTPNVTGAGARYVAAGRKQQESAQVRSMAKQFTNVHPISEVAPPVSSAPTGTEHLSAPLFKGNTNPRRYEISHPVMQPTSQMHPGGFGSAKPSRATPAYPSGFSQMNMTTQRPNASMTMGNIAPGASMTMRSMPKAPKPTTVSGQKTTVKASTNLPPRSGKSKIRNAAQKPFKVARSPLRIHASRFAGRLAGHLKTATGASS